MGLRNKKNKPVSSAICNNIANKIYYLERDLNSLAAFVNSRHSGNYLTTDQLITDLNDSIAEIERIKKDIIDYEQSGK